MGKPLVLAAALILTLSGNASCELVALGNAVRLSWTYTATDITFMLVANTTGWAAIGFSPHGGMEGADIAMIVVQNGSVVIQDRYAIGMSLPALDTKQDYKILNGSFANGQLSATFNRLLDTCDPKDAVIKSFTTKVIVAYGTLDASGIPQYHGPNQRTSTSVYLLSKEPMPPNDAGVFYIDPIPQNITVRNDSETIYWCSVVQLPRLTYKTHIIEMRPMITPGNEDLVHHMLVYTCEAPVIASVNSFDCFDGSDQGNQGNCMSLIGTWGVGGTILRFPSNVGLPLENGTSDKYVLIQTHYNNMGHVSGRVDASYIRFVATQNLRLFDAGILETGLIGGMLVPPNVDQTFVTGYCPNDCLNSSVLPSSGINIFAVALHSHWLGRRITLRHFRPAQNSTLPIIADDPSYDFEYQEAIYLESPRVILPGDVLQTTCLMNSSGRNVSTQGGPGTMQEMCLSFIYYYPKVGLNFCATFPPWLLNSTHPMYQLLGKNYSSFDWNAGVNDGLVGANWSSSLMQTLKNGYTMEVNGLYCMISNQAITDVFSPPVFANAPLPIYNAYTQQCLSANISSYGTTATSTGAIGAITNCSAGILVAFTILAIFKATVG